MNCIIYTRQSLSKDGDELAIDRQEEACRELAERRGLTVLDVIADNNVSASTGKRPGYARLLTAIESGTIEAVVVLRLDRLLRKLTELEALIELSERTGVQIVTVQGDLDISNAQGRLLGRILASVARSEVEVKSERHKLANRQRASQGKPHGSRRPFGYEQDMLTLRESEADLLREMARRIIGGQGYKHVAHWLNAEGHTTSMGGSWYAITVRNLLRKPRYGGFREYNGELFPAQWPPVFEPALYERLHLTMRLKSENAPDKPRGRKYLLTGLLTCGKCGLPLTGSLMKDRPSAPKRRAYMCRGLRDTGLERGCGGVRRNADALDHYVREQVIDALDVPELREMLVDDADPCIGELLGKSELIKGKLNELVDDYASRLLSREQFARAKATAEAALREVDRELESVNRKALHVDIPAGETVRDAWMRADDEWRRRLIGLVIKRVVARPGLTKPYYLADGVRYRFDPTLIEIEWV